MATFIMLGKYSSEAVKHMSPGRTKDGVNLIRKFNGEVQSMYALLGENDLMFVVTFPGIEQAMQASVALSKMSGVSFTTSPAVTVGEFDQMITQI